MNSVLKKVLPVVLLIWPYLFFCRLFDRGREREFILGVLFGLSCDDGSCLSYEYCKCVDV